MALQDSPEKGTVDASYRINMTSGGVFLGPDLPPLPSAMAHTGQSVGIGRWTSQLETSALDTNHLQTNESIFDSQGGMDIDQSMPFHNDDNDPSDMLGFGDIWPTDDRVGAAKSEMELENTANLL